MALDFNAPFQGVPSDASALQVTTPKPKASGDPLEPSTAAPYSDEELLDMWEKMKHESLDGRWSFERQWQRNIWYVLGRQWIEYQSKFGGWRDKRMAAWIPRPVTNKCKETVQAIRAMFTSITLGVNVRPNGASAANVSAAATADELGPLLHEQHHMDQVMTEFDFWLVACGNAFLHTFLDYDIKYGSISITSEQCQTCQTITTSDKLAGAQPVCPSCGGNTFAPAIDEATGQPIPPMHKPQGKATTLVLSPLEIAFPHTHPRFEDLPYVIRMRWRTRRWMEAQPQYKSLIPTITWNKAPMGQSLALFQSLSQANDLGVTPVFLSEGSSGSQNEDGIAEYEVWMKPTEDYPDGLVFRILGEGSPMVVHAEDTENIPGPLPYQDADGKPLFTFAHAAFEHMGGRLLGSGPLDVIIQKQDQLNQLDSMILLIIQRMSNPVWLEPKGAEIQKLTGMPGLVIKWNPLTVGGNAKPERIPGVGPDASLFTIREQYLRDIEELAGTFDVIKGQKPAGVEAFSALQLLVERSQSRFSSVFQSRGVAYRNWFKFAIELEREFGPDEYTKAVQTPARSWTFKNFKRANLQGSVTIVVEDGSTTPKTSLGMRASVEHANTLGMLNMKDPDQQYEGLKLFGLTRMVPTLDIHVQAALQKQQSFEEWVVVPQNVQQYAVIAQQRVTAYQQAALQVQQMLQVAATNPSAPLPPPMPPPPDPLEGSPLEWLPWYNPFIHRQEFLKWANDDTIRELMAKVPAVKKFLQMHLAAIESAIAALNPPPEMAPIQTKDMGQAGPGGAPAAAPSGAGAAMHNANQNAGAGKPNAVPGKSRVPPPA